MKKRREPVSVEDRVGPTPETLAKLLPDQVKQMFDRGQIGLAETDAASEIRTVFFAVVAGLFARAHTYDPKGGRNQIPDWIATAHKERYKPFAQDMGRSMSAIIDCLIDGKTIPAGFLASALQDYAQRMGVQKVRHTIVEEVRA
jgi:hypothetical protein